MSENTGELNALMNDIERLIPRAMALNLEMTARLLRMACLDLMTVIHGVGDDELDAFAESLAAFEQPGCRARCEAKAKAGRQTRSEARSRRLFAKER